MQGGIPLFRSIPCIGCLPNLGGGGGARPPRLSSGREWLEGEEEALLAAEGEGEDDRLRTWRTQTGLGLGHEDFARMTRDLCNS